MSDPFKPVDRDTPYLLPPSLQDWQKWTPGIGQCGK